MPACHRTTAMVPYATEMCISGWLMRDQ
jgi:hypothetical protein